MASKLKRPFKTDLDPKQSLEVYGLAVIPTGLSAVQLESLLNAFFEHLRTSPEFRDNPDIPIHERDFVLGGFAALNIPSFFHNLLARDMREKCMAALLQSGVLSFKEGQQLEMMFDRFMFRRPNKRPCAESMHRDMSPTALPDDRIFGGWLQMSSEPSFFSCCPETHDGKNGQDAQCGFSKIAKTDHGKYRVPDPNGAHDGWKLVEVPPGAFLLFDHSIVHEVLPTLASSLMICLFFLFV